MPHKFNVGRRDKIPKQKHSVINWPEYNEGLRRRADLAVWISEDALSLWSAQRRKTRGGQPRYSDLAIELCMTLGMVFQQPLRQTQGLMRSIAALLGVEIAVPDFSTLSTLSTLSRRGNGLVLCFCSCHLPSPKIFRPVLSTTEWIG
ncbi:transposase [Sulfitobacter sp. SK012]|uniref:transposase n=1 Tax=Sulfitobacter sp. SK012 TaxID=1389005 RepID=UPI00267D250D